MVVKGTLIYLSVVSDIFSVDHDYTMPMYLYEAQQATLDIVELSSSLGKLGILK